MAIAWREFVDLVAKHQKFLITTHQRADCDAIGSELAMAAALESLGKEVRVVNADPVPDHIAFLDVHEKVEVLGEDVLASELVASNVDVFLIVDTSAWQQIGPMGEVMRASSALRVVIDHHASSDDMGAVMFKNDLAEANGRLVLEAIEALGVPLNEEMATSLFAAIATDTGWFRFASVGSPTFVAIEKLVSAGASPTDIFASLYERNTLGRVQLHGRVMASMVVENEGRLAHGSVLLDDFAATGAVAADTEDVVNRLLSVMGVEVAAIFVELDSNSVKISLRSRSTFNVREVAEQFGGGGHRAAAGLRIAQPLSVARQAVLDALTEAMKQSGE
jgi:bifunctional oligoribonuclease and PAP phosphatase NrnA